MRGKLLVGWCSCEIAQMPTGKERWYILSWRNGYVAPSIIEILILSSADDTTIQSW